MSAISIPDKSEVKINDSADSNVKFVTIDLSKRSGSRIFSSTEKAGLIVTENMRWIFGIHKKLTNNTTATRKASALYLFCPKTFLQTSMINIYPKKF